MDRTKLGQDTELTAVASAPARATASLVPSTTMNKGGRWGGGALWLPCSNQPPPELPHIELNKPLNKRQMALVYGICQLMRTGPLFLWTFTFKEVYQDEMCAERCRAMMRRLNQKFGRIGSVRAFELHPGGHGLHCHVVMNRRLPAREVWRIAGKTGLGRVDVVKVKPGDEVATAIYMTKYFTKETGGIAKGVRSIAFGGISCRLRDVQVDSRASRALKFTWRKCKSRGATPTRRDLAHCRLTGEPPLWTM